MKKSNRRIFISVLGAIGISAVFSRRVRAWVNLGFLNKRVTPTLPTPSITFTSDGAGGYYTASNKPAGATVNWTWNMTAGHGETHYAAAPESWIGAAPASFTHSNTDSTAYVSNAYCTYTDAVVNWSLSVTYSKAGYITSAAYTNAQNINATTTCYGDYSDSEQSCGGYFDTGGCQDCQSCNCN